MSLVKITSGFYGAGIYQAQRNGVIDPYIWSVIVPDSSVGSQPMAFADSEIERFPAHRGEYRDWNWGEGNPDLYDRLGKVRHRKEGEAS